MISFIPRVGKVQTGQSSGGFTAIIPKKKHNIRNRKLNCSLHTKKTNNINKLMQISYHSTLTKIQKLQN